MSHAAENPEQLRTELAEIKEKYREAQETLRKLEEAQSDWGRRKKLYKIMTESVDDLIAVIDSHGHRVWNNAGYMRVLGYTPEELEGTYSLAEVHPDDQASVVNAFHELSAHGTSQTLEYRMKHKNETWVELESHATPVVNDEGRFEGFVLVARDISLRKAHERQTLAQEHEKTRKVTKQSALEINDATAQILGQLTIARGVVNSPGALGSKLHEIEKMVLKLCETAERLTMLAPVDEKSKRLIKLATFLKETAQSVLRGTLARAEFTIPVDIPDVTVNEAGVRSAFEAIFTNAMQSMHSGVIRVVCEPKYIGADFKDRVGITPGNYVAIHLRDQGTGIPEKNLARVFEPHFTTRPKGTGMGLALALSAIQREGGTITIVSTLNVGTTVTVYLPFTKQAAGPAVSVPDTAKLTQAKAVTIQKRKLLLMDDEAIVLDIISKSLQRLGYEVTTAHDGSEAIALYLKAKEEGAPHDVIIMDLLVDKGIGGEDAIRTLRQVDVEVRCIVASGHSDHPTMLKCADFGFQSSIAKPYKIEQLQTVIETVLKA